MMKGRTPTAGTLVDVGGGTGVGTQEATRTAPAGAYARCVVLDPQRGMLVRGSRKRRDGPALEWVRGTGSRLPLSDGSVDLVLSFGVLCCMDGSDVPSAVAEIYRVTRPAGHCLLGIPKGWARFTDPLFRTAGFHPILQQRPGRVLYQRPAPNAIAPLEPAAGRLSPPG